MPEVHDQFTVASDINLVNHTPTPTGDGWTSEFDDASGNMFVRASDDICKSSGTSQGTGLVFSVQPDPTVAEYDVEALLVTVDGSADDTWGLVARMFGANPQDDNYNTRGSGSATTKIEIRKLVTGTPTVLDTTAAGYQNGKTYKFEIRDATKKLFEDGVEIASTTNDDITGAGKWGFGYGDVLGTADDDTTANWEFDEFKCTEVAAGGAVVPARSIPRAVARGILRGVK